MIRGARLNLALVLALAGLMALIMWLMQRETAEAAPLLAEVSFEEVRELRVELPDAAPLAFERDGDGWLMREPLPVPADPGRLHNIVDALAVPSRARYPAQDLDLDALGLGETPRARLVVDGVTYLFGNANPVNGWRYIQRGATVHLVDDILFFRLGGTPQGWAQRQPLPPGARIARIDAGEFTIVRAEDGWALSPENPDVPAEALQRVVDAWANAVAMRVVEFDDHLQFENVAHIWLDGHERPIDFILRRWDDHMAVIRPDLALEYRLPLYRAEDLWIIPESLAESPD